MRMFIPWDHAGMPDLIDYEIEGIWFCASFIVVSMVLAILG